MKKQNVVKKNVVVQNTAAAEIDNSKELHALNIKSYCYKEDKRTMTSAAAQLTKELTLRKMTLNDCVAFCQQFYKNNPNSNCTWLCDDKTAKSTMNKHVSWLYWKQEIIVSNENGKYFINM